MQGVAEEKRSKARIGEAKAWRSWARLSAAKELHGKEWQGHGVESFAVNSKGIAMQVMAEKRQRIEQLGKGIARQSKGIA